MVPFADCVVIFDEESPCTVPATREWNSGPSLLSAVQVKKGLRHQEETYLVALKDSEGGDAVIDELPQLVRDVLREFRDVMPNELPKKLPPRREVDHRIELAEGAKPPAMAPYRMAPVELAELRRQLKELLDAGMIRPSKSPYGAPVLFQKKADGDEPKTACVTRYGAYEFLVMPFGLPLPMPLLPSVP